jgi:hypothetical protein
MDGEIITIRLMKQKMKTDLERKFIKNNSVSKEDFMAQFEAESMEITVEVRYCWHKGVSPFPLFGKESLASFDYLVPWLNDLEGPLGAFGKVFWFCKKSIFGYPYKPEFKVGRIYRLCVRPGRFTDMPRYRYFLLDEILEENVDLTRDDNVYRNALERYYKDTESEAVEMSVLIRRDIDIKNRKMNTQYSVNNVITAFKAVRFAGSGNARMIDGILEIPFDDRDFIGNRSIKLKAGSIIRITARRRTAREMENIYILNRLLETNIQDNELQKLSAEALVPGKWHIDGIGDFDVKNGEATGVILWDLSDNTSEVDVTLTCDRDNPKSAALATAHLIKVLGNKSSFERKIYDLMIEEFADANGMIVTWEGEKEGDVTLTKEEFISRLHISNLWLKPDGSGSVWIDLDEMFTDHAYAVDINADGTFETQGLMG